MISEFEHHESPYYLPSEPIYLHDRGGSLIIESTAGRCGDVLRVPVDDLHQYIQMRVQEGRLFQADHNHLTLMTTRSKYDRWNLQEAYCSYFKWSQDKRRANGLAAEAEDIELVEDDQVYDWEMEGTL